MLNNSEPKNPTEVYYNSLEEILDYTGLRDLSLIEKVALKKISNDSFNRSKVIVSNWTKINPVSETIAIFLESYYDFCDTKDLDINKLTLLRYKLIKEKGYDLVAEYFRKKQEEMHIP